VAKLLDNSDYYDMAERLLRMNKTNLERMPRAHLSMLGAADFYLNPPKEIAIAGTRDSDQAEALLTALHGEFIPNKVVAFIDPQDDGADALAKRIPLLAAKGLVDGKAAAYVCKDFACQRPVTTPEAFLKVLGAKPGVPTT